MRWRSGWWWWRRRRQGGWRSRSHAFPSSTLTAWGLIAPVRAGLACPAEESGSWSLLVIPPAGALRASRRALPYIYSGWLTFMPSSGPFPVGSGAEGGAEW